MKKSLLVVDDDEVMVMLLTKLFEKKYMVFTASDGVEAMHYLYKGIVPDLIISDLMMENITGYEFIKHLQTSAFYGRIPIIILSGTIYDEINEKYSDVYIINKPFDPIALQKLVDANISKTKQTEFASNN